jgi:hypothetical protein
LIAVVEVSGGECVRQKAGTDFRANQIDFKVKDFDLNRPFSQSWRPPCFRKAELKLQAQIGPIGSQTTS